MTTPTLEETVELHQSGQLEDAEAAYLSILADEPENAEALKLIGILSCQLEKFDEGISYLEAAVELDGSISEYHVVLGHAYLSTGSVDPGIASLRKAGELDPGRADVYGALGDVYQQAQNFPEALSAYQRAMVIDPDSVQYRLGAGISAVFAGQHDFATEYLRQVVAENGGLSAAHYGLSLISAEAGDMKAAWQHISDAVELEPENPEYKRLKTEFGA